MTNEELCILAQKGDSNAENELTRNLLPSLKALAAKFEAQYSGLQIEADDLLQEASIGLLKAIHAFRVEKGNMFQTYASRVAENAMMDYVRTSASAIPSTGQILSLDIEPHKDQDNDEGSFYESLFRNIPRPRSRFISRKKPMRKSIMRLI